MIPKEPAMLLSYINMKLRDFYHTLELCCEDLDLDQKELVDTLAGIGYEYCEKTNQFIPK